MPVLPYTHVTLAELRRLRTSIRNAWDAARDSLRTDAARMWPRPGDLWQESAGDACAKVSALGHSETDAGVGVIYYTQGRRCWAPMERWPAMTQGMRLVRRGGT